MYVTMKSQSVSVANKDEAIFLVPHCHSLPKQAYLFFVERGSSAVECRTRTHVSPGWNPVSKIGHFRSLHCQGGQTVYSAFSSPMDWILRYIKKIPFLPYCYSLKKQADLFFVPYCHSSEKQEALFFVKCKCSYYRAQ